MLLHCRWAHKAELETIETQTEKSTQKSALQQQDVSKLLHKSSYKLQPSKVVYNAANTVIHDKMPFSRFNSLGFRRSFELIIEDKFVLAKRTYAGKITRSICDDSRAAVRNAFAEQTISQIMTD
jgi:hypothetical protein